MNHSYSFVENLIGIEQTDAMVIDRIRNHDEQTLSILCESFGPIVLGYVSVFFQSVDDREDILHDILLEIWNRPQSIRTDEDNIYRWIISSTRRRIISKYKDHLTDGGIKRIRFEDVIQKITTAELSDEESTQSSEARMAVASAFFRCSVEQQRLLILGYFLGMSCEEIGNEIHHPADVVRFRLAKGVSVLSSAISSLSTKTSPQKCQYGDACALFAIGLSDPDDFKDFYAHLQTDCKKCREEISQYRDVLSMLPLMFRPVFPSPEFKERILFTAQLALVMKSDSSADKDSPMQPSPVKDDRGVTKKLSITRTHSFFIAGMLLIVAVLTWYVITMSDKHKMQEKEINDQQNLITRITENLEDVNDILGILNAPDLRLIILQGTNTEKSTYGKIFCSATLSAAVLQVANLPTQPGDKEYRLWMHAGKTMYLLHKFSIQKYFTKSFLTRFELPEQLPKMEGNIFLVTLESINSQAQPEGKQYLVGMSSGRSNR